MLEMLSGAEGVDLVAKYYSLGAKEELVPECEVCQLELLRSIGCVRRESESNYDDVATVREHEFVGSSKAYEMYAITSLLLSGSAIPEFEWLVPVDSAGASN